MRLERTPGSSWSRRRTSRSCGCASWSSTTSTSLAGFGFADVEPGGAAAARSTRRCVGCAPATRRPTSPCARPDGDEWTVGAGTASVEGDRGALLGWLGRGLTDGRDRRTPPRDSPKDGDDDDLHRARGPRRPDRHPAARARDDPQDVGLARCTTTSTWSPARPPASSCSSMPPTTRTAACCSCARAPGGSTTSSPRTSTGTTCARSRRSPAPPGPRPTPAPTTPTRCRWRPTCGWRTATSCTVGELELDVIHLRGHTPGSVALSWADPDGGDTHLFTGDSLFPGGVGNTKNPGQSFDSLYARRRRAGLRHPRRRHLVLPRPRRRLDDRGRAPAPRGVARPRLVTPAVPRSAPAVRVRPGSSRPRSRRCGSRSARRRG